LKRAVATIYLRLYGQELNWDDYHTWTQETKQKVRESAKHCMMCIIDMDYEGQEKNIEKKQVIPPEIVGAISKMGISGVTDDDGIRFHEAQYARDYYLRKLRWHSERYPESRGQRFLVMENIGELYDETLNHYFYEISEGEYKTMVDKMTADRIKQQKKLDKPTESWQIQGDDKDKKTKGVALFPQGKRETFGQINGEFKNYFKMILANKPGIGFNFYCTALMAKFQEEDEKTGKKRLVEFTVGKSHLVEQYFDLILTLRKNVDIKTDNQGRVISVKTKDFTIDTGEGAKNRLCPDFLMIISGKGAVEFFKELYRRKQLEEDKFTKGNVQTP
jgi:hypothetical protein